MTSAAVNFALIFVFAGLGEEFGWRGPALPRLQQSRGPLAASVLVGLMWFAWYLPLGFGTRE
ncbi:membrane protease YdiL (CAAX protease family) [Spinactinospora alkalitolerans]|uniref:Membrane protease YdiL (CAAX protease family) n=1 Tax=Spinactinospora alkalitolerans TaxID=687207 RepID=A0A852U5N9_9ACTN|nr:CPBP family intramembrane glutamic endopeptidase [Spinactinospora alkalitolerans]NYE50937.1 membrane protease YdiL (CAAX protease family) [Spinactinospora alkalitolerans]